VNGELMDIRIDVRNAAVLNGYGDQGFIGG